MQQNGDTSNNHETGLYIGMMSGTSLDGLDAVLCRFTPKFTLVASHSVDFDECLRAELLALCQPNGVSDLPKPTHKTQAVELQNQPQSELDVFGHASVSYAKLATRCVHELLAKAGCTPAQVCAIGCHGQTVRHRPELSFSLQLLDAAYLAEHTAIAVISDLRRRDMAAGGQGAPLVPAFHQAVFYGADKNRVLVNLGGIANITVLPAGRPKQTTGYDTGPANLLLDAWCHKHTGKAFDADGQWAASGQVYEDVLKRLLAHPFFNLPAPKSTGREDFHLSWLEHQLDGFVDVTATDVQTTLVELTVQSTAAAIAQTCGQMGITGGEVFVCGGGAHNSYLMRRLAKYLPQWTVQTTEAIGLAPTWVEACAFAWLARQHELSLTGNLPSVTGANKAVVLGSKTPA